MRELSKVLLLKWHQLKRKEIVLAVQGEWACQRKTKACAVWKGENFLLIWQSLHLFQDSLLMLRPMPTHHPRSCFDTNSFSFIVSALDFPVLNFTSLLPWQKDFSSTSPLGSHKRSLGGSNLKLEESERKQNSLLSSSRHISWRKIIVLSLLKLVWWILKYFGHSKSWPPL